MVLFEAVEVRVAVVINDVADTELSKFSEYSVISGVVVFSFANVVLEIGDVVFSFDDFEVVLLVDEVFLEVVVLVVVFGIFLEVVVDVVFEVVSLVEELFV